MFKRLITYGCSITSGFELSDSSYFPEYSEEELDKEKQKISISIWAKKIESRVSLQRNDQENKNLAWPRWIAQHFDLEYINRAVPGGNNQSSIYFLEEDISNNIINNQDLIIIGHTEFTRYFWINNQGEPKYGCINGVKDRWPSKKFHDEYVAHVLNDHHLLYQWYRDLKYLDLLSKKLNGNLLQVFCYKTFNNEIKTQTDLFFNKFADHKNFKSILDNEYSFDNLVNWNNLNDTHGFTHPKLKYHKLFADKMIEKIINFYQLS